MRIQSLGWGDPLEKGMATYSRIAWRIPWTEDPGAHTHTHTMGLGTLALRTSGGVQCSMVRIAQHRLLADSPVSTEYRTESRELENSNIN